MISIALFFSVCFCYKPVVFLHGFDGSFQDFNSFAEYIQENHPGTEIHSLHFFSGVRSRVPIKKQVENVINQILELKKDGNLTSFHLIAHSQGGLIGRAVLQILDNHGVENFISLSGIQYGWFGIGKGTKYIPKFLLNKTLSEISKILYTRILQEEFSLSNYWRDPLMIDKYYEFCDFFTKLNNQTFNEHSSEYKRNFLSTKSCNFFGGPDDGVISPWESSLFGFYKNGDPSVMFSMFEQDVYINDWFGLKTMYEEKRLKIHSIPGLVHDDWINNKEFFKSYILDLLN